MRIAGVVVLYHPKRDVIDNILSYLDQVEFLVVVDNSESINSATADEIRQLERVHYVANTSNLGVAYALNLGAEHAIIEGFDFLLTMDQDSKATPGMVATMLKCLEVWNRAHVGIISPFHRMIQTRELSDGRPAFEEVMTPMTSGNLLNLRAYKQVGPFLNELFIDFVDNEYCLRLRKHGFSVLRSNIAVLEHSVGDTKKFWIFVATNHSPLRRYYKTRNRFLVNRLYRRDFRLHCFVDRVRMLKEIGSILFFEKEKMLKLNMMWQGYKDYRRGRFGRYENSVRSQR